MFHIVLALPLTLRYQHAPCTTKFSHFGSILRFHVCLCCPRWKADRNQNRNLMISEVRLGYRNLTENEEKEEEKKEPTKNQRITG